MAGKSTYQKNPHRDTANAVRNNNVANSATNAVNTTDQDNCNCEQRSKKGVGKAIKGIFFYLSMIMIVLLAYQYAAAPGGPPRGVFGYSAMTVLTGSMQKEIPKGSLVVTKQVEPHSIKVGDNITFMRDAHTSVTHQVVGIYENYENSGMRGFQTQGVNNIAPDKDIVKATNVVGKVVFHNKTMGDLVTYIKNNTILSVVIAALIGALVIALQALLSPKRHQQNPSEPKPVKEQVNDKPKQSKPVNVTQAGADQALQKPKKGTQGPQRLKPAGPQLVQAGRPPQVKPAGPRLQQAGRPPHTVAARPLLVQMQAGKLQAETNGIES